MGHLPFLLDSVRGGQTNYLFRKSKCEALWAGGTEFWVFLIIRTHVIMVRSSTESFVSLQQVRF